VPEGREWLLRRLITLASACVWLWTSVAPAALGGEVVEPAEQPDRQRVIVVFEDAVTDPDTKAHELAREFGARPEFVYRHALKGFVVEVPPQAVAALTRNPLVASVEQDQVAHITTQTLPTGMDRVEADQNPNPDIDGADDVRIDVDIAVLDTGIDLDHPDLNVSTTRATNCTVGPCQDGPGDDGNGHGSHVAGSAAALDNGIGPVGVAPGARLWSVKVLSDSGSGSLSWIIAGIDWVTARADQIEVANMSLGCECPSVAMNTAITNSVAAGLVYAVAAGNNAKNASTFHPAAHPDVITVSALADFDGRGGGGASPTCRPDEDDTLANFSNFGPLVEISAPGVCIYSTWMNGSYNTISGTSMASPHTAGAAGLFIALNGRDRDGNAIINKADADAVRSSLIAAALPQSHQCGYINERAPQGSIEPLLFVNGNAFGGDGTCDVIELPPSAYSSAVLADRPIAYWRLGESSGVTAIDATGTGHNAIYRNSPTLGVPGLIDANPDTAVSFDGINERIGVRDATDINTGGPYATRTVELWFQPDQVTNRQVLYEQGGTSRGLGIYLFSGQIYVIGWSTAWAPLWVSAPVTTQTRYHVVLVLDQPGSRLEGFLNGTSMGIATGAGKLQNTTDNIAIAAMEQATRFHDGPVTGAAGYHFDGVIDEVALYGTALTATQIQNHHTIGTGASVNSPPSVSWVSPLNGGVVSGIVPIRVQASDVEDPAGSLTVEWRVDGGAWQPAPFNANSGYYESSWDTTGVSDGGHSLEARATDSAARTGTQTISVTVSNTASAYSSAVLADGPIAYWRLGESSGVTAIDATGTGHNAIYRNSPTLGVLGLIDADSNTTVSFDGTDDRVGVPDATDINTGGPYVTRTVELWFQPDRVNKRQVLYEQGGTTNGLGIYLLTGQVYVIGWSTAWAPLWVSAAVTTGTRYHVVLVLDQPGSRLEGFLNGTSMGIATGAGQLPTSTDNIAIAAMEQATRFHDGPVTGAAGYHFDGIVDEVALYGTALTTTQIQNHHTIGTGAG
jgi:subtilisin family serine protease